MVLALYRASTGEIWLLTKWLTNFKNCQHLEIIYFNRLCLVKISIPCGRTRIIAINCLQCWVKFIYSFNSVVGGAVVKPESLVPLAHFVFGFLSCSCSSSVTWYGELFRGYSLHLLHHIQLVLFFYLLPEDLKEKKTIKQEIKSLILLEIVCL